MNNAILKTLMIILITFGFFLLITAILSIREKKIAAWKRVLGFVIVFSSFVIPAYFGGIPFLLVIMLIVAIGSAEFYFLTEQCNIRAFKTTGVIFSTLLPVAAFVGKSEIFHITIVLFTLMILAMPIYKRQIKKDLSIDIQSSSATILGILYVGWATSYLILIRSIENGLNYLFFFYLLIWVNDVFSYYIGKLFGKTKIFPLISPGKSLQGSLGGMIATLLFACLFRYLIPNLGIGYVLLFGAIIAISGQLGDLVESSLKREAQVKDAGRLLPGIGGILDRFDSLIFASPIAYLFLMLVSL